MRQTGAMRPSCPPEPDMGPRLSLLHASYHRSGGPLEVKQAWLEAADRPELIEYIVALDDDDEVAIAQTEGQSRVVSPAIDNRVTAVRNWNAAAELARGDLLIVIADDLFPPPGWDTLLQTVTSGLDPRSTAFAVKITDDPRPKETKLRHPVVSRQFYRRFGLFSELFDGLYCDDDITMTAFRKSFILDGRCIVTEHRHPILNDRINASRSHDRMNDPAQYATGKEAFTSRWPSRHRAARVRLLRTRSRSSCEACRLRLIATGHRMLELTRYFVGKPVRPVKRAVRKRRAAHERAR